MSSAPSVPSLSADRNVETGSPRGLIAGALRWLARGAVAGWAPYRRCCSNHFLPTVTVQSPVECFWRIIPADTERHLQVLGAFYACWRGMVRLSGVIMGCPPIAVGV